MPFITLASGLVALLRDHDRRAVKRKSGYDFGKVLAGRLEELGHLPADWIQEVLDGDIDQTSIPRVGYIVCVENCHFFNKFSAFVNQGLPIWFDISDGSQDYAERQKYALSIHSQYP